MINIDELIALMEEKGVTKKEDITGIHDADIQILENYFGFKFPATYVQFLQYFGRAAGYLSPWMSIYFDDLKGMRSQFELLLASQAKEVSLPHNALLIGNWESIFDYIICGENPDPAVYRVDLFNDTDNPSHQYTESYSKYLINMVESADTSSIPSDFFEEMDALASLDTHY